MPVIAVVNSKGGSGKSTLATNLASHFANAGLPVMLGDADRQQSTQSWLRQRTARGLPNGAPVVGWAVDPQRVLRPPPGVRHVVLDTPGGLRGFDLARVVACADVVLVPVGASAFDRASSAGCIAELKALPRVAAGLCQVAAVGMRLDARTRAAEALQAWAGALGIPFAGFLRETQSYVRCAETGLGVFDLPAARGEADVAQWQPILAWLDEALRQTRRPTVGGERLVPRALPPGSLRASAAHATAVPPAGAGAAVSASRIATPARPLPASFAAPVRRRRSIASVLAACFGWLPSPRIAHR